MLCTVQNILLAIHILGLGGVWHGIYLEKNHVNLVSKFMNLLEYKIAFALIQVGKPTIESKIDNRFNLSCIHYEMW